jgi:peptidyl-tRNA hydrolase, PTH1 family
MAQGPDPGEDEQPWLVVGLGNPGPRYEGNRHNIGAMVVEEFAAGLGERFSGHRSGARLAQTRLGPRHGRPGPRVLLARPTSYMNESGGQVSGLLSFFGLSRARLLVVHDELDIAFGLLRLKQGGGEGGHNGLRSISRSVGGQDYARLRMGIGRPPGRMDPADFVLRDFPRSDRGEVELMIAHAVDALVLVLEHGWPRAQNEVNARREESGR